MARYRLELGPVPLHHQVYLDLRAALDAGEWRPGDQLPPERELAERYGCSLITVRRALDELAREQRLERTRGRGTFVLAAAHRARPRRAHMTFTEEMQRRGLDPETRLIAARPESAGETVAAALGLEPGSPTLYLERLRLADGEPLLLEQVHLPGRAVPGPARVRPRARLAVRPAHRPLRHPRRPGPRGARAGPPARAARRACSGASRGAPALLIEGIAFDRGRHAGRVRPDVRPRRPHPLLRRTRRRPPDAGSRRGDVRGATATVADRTAPEGAAPWRSER